MKETIMKGLECCVDFYCEDCPYKQFDDNANYSMKCVHRLQVDLYKYLTEITENEG